jgi:hypothetical protein
MSRIRKHVSICQRKCNRLSSISSKKHNMCASSPMRQLASFFGKLVVGISSYTVCCWSISQPGINYLLSSKIATVMGSRLQWPFAVRALQSLVPHNNNPQSATNTFGAWLSSKLDGLAYIISPLLPESLRGAIQQRLDRAASAETGAPGAGGTDRGASLPEEGTLSIVRRGEGYLRLGSLLPLQAG